MTKSAVIFGYSGHAYVTIDLLLDNGYNIIGYCDKEIKSNNPYKLKYLGDGNNESCLHEIKAYNAFIAIGDNKIRANIFETLNNREITLPHIIHKKAFFSPVAVIGQGSIVMAGAVINSMAKIGNAVICNSASIIEHECIVGDYSHIAPGAVLAGNVTIGSNVFVGANTVIRQGITIGNNVVIGAGAVVTKDVNDNALIYGNPAKVIVK